MKNPVITFEDSFFETEERSGFVVDKVMKHAWAAGLEVLCEIDRICKKHNIKWFAMYGTLLGAVRHQGFIPWDDDLDIGMMRVDYEKFLRVAPEELGEEFYFYATKKGKKNGNEVYAAVVSGEKPSFTPEHLHRFHECPYVVGADIFPVDYVPRAEKGQKTVKSLLRILKRVIMSKDRTWKKDLQSFEELMNVTFKRDETLNQQLVEYNDRLCSMYQPEECDDVAVYAFWTLDMEKSFRKEWFEEVVYLSFENLCVPVPKWYDEILTVMYGDYMVPVKGKANHDYPFFKRQQIDFEKFVKAQGLELEGMEGICYQLTEEDRKEERESCNVVRQYYVLTGETSELSEWAHAICLELQQCGCNSRVCSVAKKGACDKPEAVVVIHGSMAGETDDMQRCRRVIWWTSKREMEKYFLNENCKDGIYMHVVSSAYLKEELKKLVELPEEHVYKVASCMEWTLPEKRIPGVYKQPLVLYNEKGAGYVEPLAGLMNWLQWMPVNKFNQEEKVTLMSAAKVYIDCGEHECVSDDLRLAVSCGCCVITNQKGCAGYEDDVPIDDKYRFVDVEEQYVEIAGLIQDICENYDTYEDDFNQFRYVIATSGERFSKDVLELVRLFLESADVDDNR